MFCRVWSMVIHGVEAVPVRVEADVSDGMPVFTIVGYVSAQVREAQDRVRTALRNLGIVLPPKRIVINLAPADIRKDGPRFDLPIAAAVLQAVGRIPPGSLEETMMIGELGLNGDVQAVNGVLSSVLEARRTGMKACILPKANLPEGRQAEMKHTYGISSLRELLAYCCGTMPEEEAQSGEESREVWNADESAEPWENSGTSENDAARTDEDFDDLLGQEGVKRAAVISASGFHNLLLIGPPGSGKSMTARRIPSILPPMTREEQLEVTRLYSIAGLLPSGQPLIRNRPFRAPHHSITAQALVGGGRFPSPGEITLAHRGVLFLDELPEMSRRVLELLRQPLEEHQILISRQEGTYLFPAAFVLVAAMNPCPCGHYPDREHCRCSEPEISRYLGKISQAFLDRMDLCMEVPAVSCETLMRRSGGKREDGITSAQMRLTVARAREAQEERYRGSVQNFNSELKAGQMEKFCPMTPEASRMMAQAYRSLGLSARGFHRVLKVARTIADMEACGTLGSAHVGEALCCRSMDKKIWRV